MADEKRRLVRLGLALKEFRMRAGLSEREVALGMKRSSRFIRACEAGNIGMTIDELQAAAAVLRVSVNDLIDVYQSES